MEDINSEIVKVAELSKKTNELLEKLGLLKEFDNREELIFNKDITAIGTGSHILLSKHHTGKKATIIIRKKEEGLKK